MAVRANTRFKPKMAGIRAWDIATQLATRLRYLNRFKSLTVHKGAADVLPLLTKEFCQAYVDEPASWLVEDDMHYNDKMDAYQLELLKKLGLYA